MTPETLARMEAHFAKTLAMNEAKQAVIDAARAMRANGPADLEPLDALMVAVEALEKLEKA